MWCGVGFVVAGGLDPLLSALFSMVATLSSTDFVAAPTSALISGVSLCLDVPYLAAPLSYATGSCGA